MPDVVDNRDVEGPSGVVLGVYKPCSSSHSTQVTERLERPQPDTPSAQKPAIPLLCTPGCAPRDTRPTTRLAWTPRSLHHIFGCPHPSAPYPQLGIHAHAAMSPSRSFTPHAARPRLQLRCRPPPYPYVRPSLFVCLRARLTRRPQQPSRPSLRRNRCDDTHHAACRARADSGHAPACAGRSTDALSHGHSPSRLCGAHCFHTGPLHTPHAPSRTRRPAVFFCFRATPHE